MLKKWMLLLMLSVGLSWMSAGFASEHRELKTFAEGSYQCPYSKKEVPSVASSDEQSDQGKSDSSKRISSSQAPSRSTSADL